MKTSDIIQAKGQVAPSFINLATGERMEWPKRHNTISYAASTAMAAAFGGDTSKTPNRIGIVYGSNKTPSLREIDRNQSWDAFKNELSDKLADVQIVTFSYSPSIKEVTKGDPESSDSASSPSGSETTGSGVTFHAHSDSTTHGYFGTAENPIFATGTYIYQAVLICMPVYGDPTILARASLIGKGVSGPEYYTKPNNFEVAIDWTIKFF